MSNTQSKKRRFPHRTKRLTRTPQGHIELLLIQHVEPLGRQGDVVHVRPGYAKNYLIPQGLATLATEHHKRMVEKHRAELDKIEKARMAGLRSLADQLGRQSVTVEANANNEGHLYGSVNAADIVGVLKKQNITIAQDQVRLKGPLKELGLYTVKIHLGHEVEADLKVWVVPTVGEDAPAEQS